MLLPDIAYSETTLHSRRTGGRMILFWIKRWTRLGRVGRVFIVRIIFVIHLLPVPNFLANEYLQTTEIATTTYTLSSQPQVQLDRLKSSPDDLGIIFKEMIQMCLWSVHPLSLYTFLLTILCYFQGQRNRRFASHFPNLI